MEMATGKAAPAAGQAQGKRLHYLRLWDVYGPLLTETQREIAERYYLYDLSLAEIAEEKEISKQAVSDALKKSRELLDSYEDRLHISADNTKYALAVSEMMTNVTRALAAFAERHPEFSEEMGAIADMVCVGEVIDLDKED